MAEITKRLAHAWNAFTDRNSEMTTQDWSYGQSYGVQPFRGRLRVSSERSIIASIYTRIAIDVASVDIRHVRMDDQNRYIEEIKSGLNNCLSVEANLDQAARQFRQDIVLTLFDEGIAAIVPVETSADPKTTPSYDIKTMRVGKIVSWYPKHVRVSLYNQDTGRREEITLMKRNVAIVENPLYNVMNEPNSTLQRLTRKLHLLDAVDEQSSSGKLDILIKLPYPVKSEMRRAQATKRREDLEFQLKGSKYGIGWIDGTEEITQLNRPTENNLWKQITDLTVMLYGELGLTPEIMNGTADEKTMLNYNNRTVEPILGAVTEAMKRTFLTKTAISQFQSVEAFRDPFKLVQMSDLAEMADKFTRNEIFSSNEIRQFIGVKPSTDPKADELRNSNMPRSDTMLPEELPQEDQPATEDNSSIISDLEDQINKILGSDPTVEDDPELPDE